jgi:hypothetical protein
VKDSLESVVSMVQNKVVREKGKLALYVLKDLIAKAHVIRTRLQCAQKRAILVLIPVARVEKPKCKGHKTRLLQRSQPARIVSPTSWRLFDDE